MKIYLSDYKKKVCALIAAVIVCFLSFQRVDGQSLPVAKLPDISAAAAVVLDTESGRLLYAKNQHSKRPMASTTKIMTAILALEYGNLDEQVTVSKRAARIGGSSMHLKEGEKCTVLELLYGLLLPSGNDAAIALAEHIGGSVEIFAEMMNEKARLIGAKNTQFKNPHGLDAEGHYSTAYDMAVIASYALRNEWFSRIVSTRHITVAGRQLYNTNEMLGSYAGADGVKTGYTGKAGRCLITSATREGRRLISVVLFCQSRLQRANNSRKILDYAFQNYNNYVLTDETDTIARLPVKKGKKPFVDVCVSEKLAIPLTGEEYKNIQRVVSMPESINAPVYAGVDVGTVSFVLDGEVMAQAKLKAMETVERKTIFDYFRDILSRWLEIYR